AARRPARAPGEAQLMGLAAIGAYRLAQLPGFRFDLDEDPVASWRPDGRVRLRRRSANEPAPVPVRVGEKDAAMQRVGAAVEGIRELFARTRGRSRAATRRQREKRCGRDPCETASGSHVLEPT